MATKTKVEIPREARHLFTSKNFGHVGTVMPDGSPQTSPVWVDLEGPKVVFNTAKGRVKPENIGRDDRVAISVHNEENPYESILVRGTAEVTDEHAEEHIDALARRYVGEDTYPFRQEGEERVKVYVTPESVSYTPPSE